MNVGKLNTLALEIAEKSTTPKASADRYPTTMDINIAIALAKPLNTTPPNIATSKVMQNIAISLGSNEVYPLSRFDTIAPVLAAVPASSRPMRATTGPIAAGG